MESVHNEKKKKNRAADKGNQAEGENRIIKTESKDLCETRRRLGDVGWKLEKQYLPRYSPIPRGVCPSSVEKQAYLNEAFLPLDCRLFKTGGSTKNKGEGTQAIFWFYHTTPFLNISLLPAS